MNPDRNPKTKVIKTNIYGLKPSGNLAERAMRMLAEMLKDKFPKAYEVIHRDFYVDDCMSGDDSEEAREHAINNSSLCLGERRFGLKGITLSGEDHDIKLSKDGTSIHTSGLKWFALGGYFDAQYRI